MPFQRDQAVVGADERDGARDAAGRPYLGVVLEEDRYVRLPSAPSIDGNSCTARAALSVTLVA